MKWSETSLVAQFSRCKYRTFFSNSSNVEPKKCNKSHFITLLTLRGGYLGHQLSCKIVQGGCEVGAGGCLGIGVSGRIVDGVPAGAECARDVGLRVVADHQMMLGVGVAGLSHCVVEESGVRFVDADVVAEHHEVEIGCQPAVGNLAVLHILESVGENGYSQRGVGAEGIEQSDCAGHQGSALGEEIEVESVVARGEGAGFSVGNAGLGQRQAEALHAQVVAGDFGSAVGVPKLMIVEFIALGPNVGGGESGLQSGLRFKHGPEGIAGVGGEIDYGVVEVEPHHCYGAIIVGHRLWGRGS